MKRGNTYSVRYNYKDHAGKPCKGREAFKTKAEAQERKITVEKELLDGTFLIPDAMTVAEMLYKWLPIQSSKHKWAPKTYTHAVAMIQNLVAPYLGKKQIQKVQTYDLEQFYATLSRTPRGLYKQGVKQTLTDSTAAVFSHVLIDVLVAHSGLSVTNTLLIKSLVQAKIGHDRGNDGVSQQLATLLHVATVDVQDMVAGNDITLFIHTQATVSIAIEGKTDVQTVLHHELLQTLDVGRASVVVDICAVGLVVNDVGICAQSIKHRLGNIPVCTVGAVQTNLDALEGVDAQREQVAHIAVAACYIVYSAADVLTMGKASAARILVHK